MEELLQRGQATTDDAEAESIFRSVIDGKAPAAEGEDIPRIKEQAILGNKVSRLHLCNTSSAVTDFPDDQKKLT